MRVVADSVGRVSGVVSWKGLAGKGGARCGAVGGELARSFDHFEHLADRDGLVLVAEREATELRKHLERLHADDGAVEHLEPADGDLVLFDEARSILEILLAGLLVHHADDTLRRRRRYKITKMNEIK